MLDNGLNVTALHNHFFYETPRIFYMHVHGHGPSADITKRIAPALALIGKTPTRRAEAAAAGKPIEGKLDTAQLAKIVGHEGEQSGTVYKITIGRPDIPLKEMGATINARMGLNTWAAFYGSDADAVVAGDVAMRVDEVTPVLKALRAKRDRNRGHSPSHDRDGTDRLLPPLLGQRNGAEAGDGGSRRSRSNR